MKASEITNERLKAIISGKYHPTYIDEFTALAQAELDRRKVEAPAVNNARCLRNERTCTHPEHTDCKQCPDFGEPYTKPADKQECGTCGSKEKCDCWQDADGDWHAEKDFSRNNYLNDIIKWLVNAGFLVEARKPAAPKVACAIEGTPASPQECIDYIEKCKPAAPAVEPWLNPQQGCDTQSEREAHVASCLDQLQRRLEAVERSGK